MEKITNLSPRVEGTNTKLKMLMVVERKDWKATAVFALWIALRYRCLLVLVIKQLAMVSNQLKQGEQQPQTLGNCEDKCDVHK